MIKVVKVIFYFCLLVAGIIWIFWGRIVGVTSAIFDNKMPTVHYQCYYIESSIDEQEQLKNLEKMKIVQKNCKEQKVKAQAIVDTFKKLNWLQISSPEKYNRHFMPSHFNNINSRFVKKENIPSSGAKLYHYQCGNFFRLDDNSIIHCTSGK